MKMNACRDCGELAPSTVRGCRNCGRNLNAEKMLAKYFWISVVLAVIVVGSILLFFFR